MAFEMICGQCRGNLLVEHFGVVVACPHCGAHLQIPAPVASAASTPPPTVVSQESPPIPPVTAAAPQPESTPLPPEPTTADVTQAPAPTPPVKNVAGAAPSTEEMRAFTGDESEPPPSVEISVVSPVAITETTTTTQEAIEDALAPTTGETGFSLSALMSSSETTATKSAPATAEPATSPSKPPAASVATPEPAAVTGSSTEAIPESAATTPVETCSTGLSGLFGAVATASPAEPRAATEHHSSAESPEPTAVALAEATPNGEQLPSGEHAPETILESAVVPAAPTVKPASRDHVTVSKSLLAILLSYAIAVTIGFVYLLYNGSAQPGSYGLESLPDPVPPKRKTSGVYQETATMPDGHDLQIGDRQRFGNIEVTVLKVTRGPIQFRHFSDASKVRLPSAPVLKLWLRFKNVSTDQEIAPLDDHLLFHRIGRDRLTYHSNQFVVRAEQKSNPDAKRVIAYDHIIGSGWDLADLPLDKPLHPGESRDYYVPTCENDLEVLTGELLWRVHIRKGFSARGNGVTTLFEVHFNSDVIRDETA